MPINLKHILQLLPEEDQHDYRSENKLLFSQMGKTCIVIDDDPTGNQTVHGIPLISSWDIDILVEEFIEGTPVFFILTNSRSVTPEAASKVYKEIAENILKASKVTQRDFTIISRSDSTLRGHFPLEPKTLQHYLNLEGAITVFLPVMFEGHRVTLNGVHYIEDGDYFTPVNETPFAKDHSFAYSKGNLKDYIEEKSGGSITSSEVYSFPIETIRKLDVKVLTENILEIPPQSYCIFDSLKYADLDKVTNALLHAEKLGKQIIYRTSSSFVPSYIGLTPKGLLTSKDILNAQSKQGGLTIVGSYVKKSSEQLHNALSLYQKGQIVEVNVNLILSSTSSYYIASLITKLDSVLEKGQDAIVFTSRTLVTGESVGSNINIANRISQGLIDLVEGIGVRPKYLIAKGGITSHDLATKGLGMQRAKVLGQVAPGIPLWEMGAETKFPRLPYIVFPGNVGDANTLKTIITKLNHYD